MNQNNHYDVIILGAGAAGLMCALIAGQGGKRVLVLEKSNKPGKKILMSGGGRCNFTNLNTSHDNFLSANPHFCKSALSRFTPWHFLDLVNKHHIPYHEKELGQLFCDHSSKDILNMLLDECAEGGVEIKLNVTVADVDVQQQVTITADGDQYISNALVMATGGLSIPKMGGSGFGYELAEQLGLNVLPRRAGLVPFVFTDQHKKLLASLSGVSIPVAVTVKESSNKQSFKHQMLFTHRGLSGPVMLQISSYWQQGNHLQIDLLPDSDGFDLLNQLNPCPQVIFTTAYDEYAIKAFEQNALDYLLKPINEKRFNQALEKALQQPQSVNNSIIDHKIFVKDNDQCWLVDIQKIRYFVSHGNYTQLFFDEHHPMVYRSLNQIEQRLPVNQFFRVNRSHIININFVKHIEAYGQSGLLLTMDDDTEIDVSRRHASHLKQALSL
ncbi:MAG: aminoacetone oxidase family FAD-binding enzyme [Xanthomonadales bacterium]|nr:aminoacetone oxidase family FAD-binding enzyme [Xanthomonadales bacterium]